VATISLRNVVKRYGKNQVIHGIDCEIADGEFIVIVGPSGCGKTTLLRMIAGLERITGGEIAIGERVVNDLEPAQRDIAMVFQNYALYPHMTVYRNMAYGLKIRGMSKAEIDQRVRKAAGILDLSDDLLHRTPRQLSGGQRQRVAMGRAIVREPKAFLFDEPLSNLDAKLRVQMRLEIKKLHRELRTTSVYVTHDQVEAMTLGHRLIVMNQGVAEQIGTPIDLYSHPRTLFVAGFIGSPAMNFLEATVAEDGTLALTPDSRLPLPCHQTPGQTLTVGIRPEHFQPAGAGNGLALQATLAEQLGADTLIHGQLAGGSQELTVRLPGIHHVEPDTRLPFTVATENLHLFDHQSGQRLNP